MIENLFDLKFYKVSSLTEKTWIASTNNDSYIIKDISIIEYSNYLKVKSLNLPIIKPVEIKKVNNHIYFLYEYRNDYSSIYDRYEGMLEAASKMVSKTKKNIPIPKMAEFKFKKIAVIANDRFTSLELKIRQIETNPIKNDMSWIYLSKYHLVLDTKLEIYKLLKKFKNYNSSIDVAVNHGNPQESHYLCNHFIGYRYIKEGHPVNDYYKIYIDMDNLDINHKKIMDKYLSDEISKRYFKLMVLYTYVLMLDIDYSYEITSRFLSITSKIVRFLNQFKEYK